MTNLNNKVAAYPLFTEDDSNKNQAN